MWLNGIAPGPGTNKMADATTTIWQILQAQAKSLQATNIWTTLLARKARMIQMSGIASCTLAQ